MKKILISLICIMSLAISSLGYCDGPRVKRKLTIPLQPGDAELQKEVPFIVDVKQEGYPRLKPDEMTKNELNHYFQLMEMKRARRDKKLKNK